MNLDQLLRDYYAPLTGVSDRTIALYEYSIKSFGEFLGRPATTDDLTELSVARWLAHRVRTKAPATASKDRAQIRACWEWAARRGMVSTWPTMPRIVVPERVPEAWLTDELQRLLDEIAQEKTTVFGFPMAAVLRAVVLVCYHTGERIGAVMSLKCSDVRGATVIFRAEGRKGRARDILRDVGPDCVAALEAIRRQPDDLAIPWDRSHSYLWTRLTIILRRAGLPCGRNSKFHRIRKTSASYYEAAVGPGSAQRHLAHSSPAVTRRYLDPRIVKPGPSAPDVLPHVG